MDEQEYHSTYKNINPIRCVFEKAINSRTCNCSKATRFNLADREGVSCQSEAAQQWCSNVLYTLREKARFAIQQKMIDGQLPHNAEIRIQNGSIKGLVKILCGEESAESDLDENDIYALLQSARAKYKNVENFPYSELMQQISAYKTRRARQRKK